jgi:hypothetical protein
MLYSSEGAAKLCTSEGAADLTEYRRRHCLEYTFRLLLAAGGWGTGVTN